MNKIEIGAVAKPQGIKGELKLRLFCDGFDSVKNVTKVELDGVIYAVEDFHSSGADEAVIKLKGLDDRNKAELLRRKEVYADLGDGKEHDFRPLDALGKTIA